MSGPKTLEYHILDDVLAQIEREREGSRLAEAERREYERRLQEGERKRLAAARAAAEEAERRLARIARMAGKPAVLPAAPKRDDIAAIEAYARALSAEAARVEASARAALAQAADALGAQALQQLAAPKSAAELLDAYCAQARAQRGAAEAPEARRERALRILGRLAAQAANSLPPDLEALMAEMIAAPGEARAEALELELRLRVQRFNDERARRERELAETDALLASLADAAATDAVRQDLELVRAGMAPLTDALRARVRDAQAAFEAQLAEERRERAARALDATLHDLGYATDGIDNTLFVEGGVAHFNKAEWGDYYVRLRVDPGEHTVNVNMVRERKEGEAADLRAADQAAETSWCDGLPRLMQTLAARGLEMKLQRHLAAGAAPVQVVEAGAIPAALRARIETATSAPKARSMGPP